MLAKLPETLTPMLTQYLAIKQQHPDSILFYRMGDFYEMFFDDAIKAAPILDVQLTSRDKNSASPIPMCGIPHHAAQGYLSKLVARGLKVALCEQVESPAVAKGIVRREVVRVVTPALIGDPDLVPEETSNYLACLWINEAETVEVALLDLLRGETRYGSIGETAELADVLCEWNPKEYLVAAPLESHASLALLKARFPSAAITVRPDYFVTEDGSPPLAALRRYLQETQKVESLPYLAEATPLFEKQSMLLDATTIAALEIVRGAGGAGCEGGPSLLKCLDRTHTPMGRRLLREWLQHPLCQRESIELRHGAVEEFFLEASLADSLRACLRNIRDLERLTTKTALGLAMPRDLLGVREILKQLPAIKKMLRDAKAPRLREHSKGLDPLTSLTDRLEQALEDEPPATLREGGIFRQTFHADIAEYRGLSRDAKEVIASVEAREKKRTGISTLKVKYSKVFGYTIEITKSHLAKAPADYIRKQTIAGGERYITEELKKLEERILTADHKLKALEESLFLELRREVATAAETLLSNAHRLAELDVLLAFAEVAKERSYVRPEMAFTGDLIIEDGRHPVIEQMLPTGGFVPNSISFSDEESRTWIITGPNMAGKSTIMRQAALIVLMAQAGSFVPAQRARLPLTDAIFTRIGSSDDLAQGRSTFMVEMTEVARIVERATPRSLILIDEIGRGTSTYDGLALAWSLLEHIHNEVRAKTLFATHFHELTALEKHLPGLKNANVLVEQWKQEIVFLHRLGPGICNRSYGIEVAKLAGLPDPVLKRARLILGTLESEASRGQRSRGRALALLDNQMVFFDELKASETPACLDS